MPYKDRNKANKRSKERRLEDLERERTYAREYARARKAGIPWVNPVPRQRVNRKGIPVGPRVDITGRRYGRLTAIGFARYVPNPSGKGGVDLWNFKCDCGTIKEINRGNVTRGRQGTCGLCRNGVLLTPEGATRKSIFTSYKGAALRRGYEFTLKEDELVAMTKLPCAVCGLPPSQTFRQGRVYSCVYTGIDRINNALGYVQGNVRPCCKWCNLAKHAWTEEQFQSWLERVVKFRTNPEGGARNTGEN